MDPKNSTLHYHLALAYKKAGDTDSARQSLTKALELNPEFPDAGKAREELASLGS